MTSDSSGESLAPQPSPTTEEPELRPGGVDSVEDPRYGTTFEEPTTPDPRPEDNPAIEDVVPDDVTDPDDKTQDPDEPEEDADTSAEASEPTG